jgi:hypothetical protein
MRPHSLPANSLEAAARENLDSALINKMLIFNIEA